MLNLNYIQEGGCCVLSSYAIIIEYFSKKEVLIEDIFARYLDCFKPTQEILNRYYDSKSSYPRSSNDKEDYICAHYHCLCWDNNKRGLDFVRDLHLSGILGTSGFCKITSRENEGNLSHQEIQIFINNLIKGGLAQICIPGHSIVVWFNQERGVFEQRDPMVGIIEVFDPNKFQSITEYIIFTDNE